KRLARHRSNSLSGPGKTPHLKRQLKPQPQPFTSSSTTRANRASDSSSVKLCPTNVGSCVCIAAPLTVYLYRASMAQLSVFSWRGGGQAMGAQARYTPMVGESEGSVFQCPIR